MAHVSLLLPLAILLSGVVACSDKEVNQLKSNHDRRIAALKDEIKLLQIRIAESQPPLKLVVERKAEAKVEAREIAKLIEEKTKELADLNASLMRAKKQAETYRTKYVLENR